MMTYYDFIYSGPIVWVWDILTRHKNEKKERANIMAFKLGKTFTDTFECKKNVYGVDFVQTPFLEWN